MPGLWEQLLGPARLGGVDLPIVSRRISGGRTIARKRLPYVSGQESESTGRTARIIDIQVALFNDMNEDDLYPDRYEELVTVLSSDDNGGVVVWEDPIWGPIDVQITKWEADETAEERDGVRLSLTLEEEGFDNAGDDLDFSVISNNDRATAREEAQEFDDLIDELSITGGDIETAWSDKGYKKKSTETTSFVDQIDAVFDAIDDGAQRADEVQDQVNRFQARVEGVIELSQISESVSGWGALDRGTRLMDAVAQAGSDVIASATKIVEYRVTGTISVYDAALALYGDVGRVDEIIAANPIQNPLFIPAGTTLRVLGS